MANTSSPKKPVEKFRYRGLSASVFENVSKKEGQSAPYFKVVFDKTYKQGESYRSTGSFGREDLPVLEHLARKAWEFILETEKARSRDGLGL